ncbi:MAG: ATP-grasp domain-containing protein [Bacteroidales bacterium]|nr:ATP-grasp domain-containing protein [Bacteroidales bacterium]
MSAKKKVTVAVTGLNAIDSPGPGVSVIRALKESKFYNPRIIGLSYESLEPGIYMHDLVDKTYQIPYPSAGTESLMKRLDYINKEEKLNAIIPNFDAELYGFMKLEKKLRSKKIKMFLPAFDQFEARQKINLNSFGEKHKLNVPRSKSIGSVDDIEKLHYDFTYPIVVKGKYYDANIAYNAGQTKSYFNKISAKWGLPVIIQQFVNGSEFNVVGLGDGKGNTIAAVPMKKLFITDKGKAWAGITVKDNELLKMTDKFIKSTKWRGGFELELMKTGDGKFYILEINPRIPAWVYLAVGAGQNIPEALLKLALEDKVEPYKSYKVGKLFVRYSYDLIVDLKEFETISAFGEL